MELFVDGRRAFVHTGGVVPDCSEGAVLLVHGAGNDHTIWRFLTRRLAAAGYPTLAVDLPAHGKSEGPALGSIEEMADWCLGVVDAAGGTEVTVVGHSMGSLIAMQVAAAAPTRMRGLALYATTERMGVHPDLQDAAEREEKLAADLIVGWTHTGRSRFGHHASPGLWMAGANRRLLERNAGSLATDLLACSAWDAGKVAERIKTRTVIVLSEHDRMVPAKLGQRLADSIADSEVFVVADGSHASIYDHPELAAEPVVGWLSQVWFD
ncbi:MAG: alpha/beta hydrolase [Acidimicrobiia bacterium]